jgi:hypothetical protein
MMGGHGFLNLFGVHGWVHHGASRSIKARCRDAVIFHRSLVTVSRSCFIRNQPRGLGSLVFRLFSYTPVCLVERVCHWRLTKLQWRSIIMGEA